MIDAIREYLTAEDDPALWAVVLGHITATLDKAPGVRVEVGRCSHWLRPHQSRWTADGGFAWPFGYGSGQGGYSTRALPQLDGSVVLEWDGREWRAAAGRSVKPAVRVSVPSRTTRHAQAAVHTLWAGGKGTETRLFGFRKRNGVWTCTAESEWKEDRQFARRDRLEREKRQKVQQQRRAPRE